MGRGEVGTRARGAASRPIPFGERSRNVPGHVERSNAGTDFYYVGYVVWHGLALIPTAYTLFRGLADPARKADLIHPLSLWFLLRCFHCCAFSLFLFFSRTFLSPRGCDRSCFLGKESFYVR